jgi:DNA-binding LacI/PurR family transcriptional regulator
MLAEKLTALKMFPTAVVCINDMTAAGAINYFLNNGIKVPDDISVFGFDNTLISEIITPSLSTIDQCIYTMGQAAVNTLIENIENPKVEISSIEFQPSVILRHSTRNI